MARRETDDSKLVIKAFNLEESGFVVLRFNGAQVETLFKITCPSVYSAGMAAKRAVAEAEAVAFRAALEAA